MPVLYRLGGPRDSFIHSDHFYSASSSPLLLRSAPDTAWILSRSFTPKRHRQLRVKDLFVQGPYVAARVRFEPTTLRLTGIDSANAPPCPTRDIWLLYVSSTTGMHNP